MTDTSLTPEEIAARGEQIYAAKIREKTTPEDIGKFCVINILTGDYEIDKKHIVALDRIQARAEAGPLFTVRIGYRAAYRYGNAELGSGQ